MFQCLPAAGQTAALRVFRDWELVEFLLVNTMAGEPEWPDLCDKRDTDVARGKLNSYAATRVWVETQFKQKVYKRWRKYRPVNGIGDLSNVQTFAKHAWRNGHEWTLRVLKHKGELNAAQLEDPELKARALEDDKLETDQYYMKFIEWIFNHLDQNLKLTKPDHPWYAPQRKEMRLTRKQRAALEVVFGMQSTECTPTPSGAGSQVHNEVDPSSQTVSRRAQPAQVGRGEVYPANISSEELIPTSMSRARWLALPEAARQRYRELRAAGRRL